MIEVRGLTKRYGSRTVVDDVAFEVGAGETFGFIGANGAGKSTTMRAIMGVLEPTSGELTWQGRPLDRPQRRRFGYMPEERGLYQKMKVLPQIAYFGELYGLSAEEAQRSAEELIERLELTQYRQSEVQALSLGNQQRAQLAVALVHDPDLLVLDEPFSGLDVVGVDALAQILRDKQAEGTPIILSSHQLDVVERLIDSVGIIHQGRMLAAGPVPDVRRAHADVRLRVRVVDARPGWQAELPGRLVSGPDANDAQEAVIAPEQTTPSDVLEVAMKLGTVEHFGRIEPTLDEIFREALA